MNESKIKGFAVGEGGGGYEITARISWQRSLRQLRISFHSLDAFQCMHSNNISLRNEGLSSVSQVAP